MSWAASARAEESRAEVCKRKGKRKGRRKQSKGLRQEPIDWFACCDLRDGAKQRPPSRTNRVTGTSRRRHHAETRAANKTNKSSKGHLVEGEDERVGGVNEKLVV